MTNKHSDYFPIRFISTKFYHPFLICTLIDVLQTNKQDYSEEH